MAVTLKYIAQSAMDLYFRDFKGNTGFFELSDFIFRSGVTVADYYQKLYEQKYQELRQEKMAKDELVGVDQDLLSAQILTVDKEGVAKLQYPVMSFFYDKSNTGYQFLLPVKPSDIKLERSSLDEVWQFDYLPKSNRVFWYSQQGTIRFKKDSACTLHEVELLYIPSVMNSEGQVLGDAMVADGVAMIAINSTVAAMKQLTANTVVKEGLDNNNNPVLQTEINPNAVK